MEYKIILCSGYIMEITKEMYDLIDQEINDPQKLKKRQEQRSSYRRPMYLIVDPKTSSKIRIYEDQIAVIMQSGEQTKGQE